MVITESWFLYNFDEIFFTVAPKLILAQVKVLLILDNYKSDSLTSPFISGNQTFFPYGKQNNPIFESHFKNLLSWMTVSISSFHCVLWKQVQMQVAYLA